MNLKRILSALLAALTLSAVLASCGETASDAPKSSAAGAETAAAAADGEGDAAEATTACEYIDPNVDYDGAEFVGAAYDSESYFWTAASYCDMFAETENGDPINDALYQRNRQVEELLNVALACYPVDVSSRDISADIKKLILAAEDLVDFAYVVGIGAATMIGNGDQLYDLGTIGTLDLTHSWWDQKSVDQLAIMGSNYLVTGDISLYSNFAPITYFVNKQLLENYGHLDIYDTVRDGKWTLDRAIAMCEEVVRDVDGDGQMTKDDAYGMLCEGGSIEYAALACGIRYTENDADGVPHLVLNSERTATFVDKYVGFFTCEGNKATIAGNYSGYGNVFTELFIPMFKDGRGLFYNNQLLVAMNLRDMDADFGILPSPKFDEAQDSYLGGCNASWLSFIMVPVTNTQLDQTGVVLDAMGYWSQQLVTPAYIDTTVTGKALRDDDSAEMLEIILASRTYDLGSYYKWGSIQSVLTGLKTTDFASAYAKVEEKALADIEKTLDAIQG